MNNHHYRKWLYHYIKKTDYRSPPIHGMSFILVVYICSRFEPFRLEEQILSTEGEKFLETWIPDIAKKNDNVLRSYNIRALEKADEEQLVVFNGY